MDSYALCMVYQCPWPALPLALDFPIFSGHIHARVHCASNFWILLLSSCLYGKYQIFVGVSHLCVTWVHFIFNWPNEWDDKQHPYRECKNENIDNIFAKMQLVVNVERTYSLSLYLIQTHAHRIAMYTYIVYLLCYSVNNIQYVSLLCFRCQLIWCHAYEKTRHQTQWKILAQHHFRRNHKVQYTLNQVSVITFLYQFYSSRHTN